MKSILFIIICLLVSLGVAFAQDTWMPNVNADGVVSVLDLGFVANALIANALANSQPQTTRR